ncbi:MAG: hypothetical protein QOJ29_1746, partial [Thermoleophilaceae bacterium]|nr:hypothetical protein [Thermoleophilaceae bacterium]
MDYGNLPIAFEANGGRTDQRVDYLARGAGWSLFLTPGESVISLAHGTRRAVVRAQLLGASRSRGVPAGGRTGTVNSFAGNDRSRWRTGIPSYAKVRYTSVYPGIDLVYYGHSGRLEYDFAVAPGGNPARIALGLKGGPAQLARNGDLVVRTAAGAVRQKRPDAYQVINGRRRRVSARFVLDGTTARISTGRYDHTRPLLIDPVLAYSGFVGGSGDDQARSIAVGPDGSAYITGITQSTDFPVDNGSSNGAPVAIDDGFVTKINPAGTARVYSTYFGGTQGAAPNGIAVDASGRAYVAGEVVGCGTFPLSHEVDSTCSGGEMFTLGLSPGGDALL